MNKKLTLLLAFVLVFAVAVVLSGCGETEDERFANVSDTSSSKTTVSKSTAKSVAKSKATPTKPASESAIIYMDATLGTLPSALVDYDLAQAYSTAEWAAQFVDTSFVPLSYCIQNGPDNVRINSEASTVENEFETLRIQTDYGSGYQDTWDFTMEIEDGEWKVAGITCVD